ncbi:ATPase [Microbacterium foliorum]|uniref:histidine kinase n=1 Tax=Microbacterium foliorum TaxID=104336 RepID=A0A4Y5YTN2_9MICO|nr:histidine kinase [Microbacterium foliorum]QDE35916.1 ATPase [Microbacterium foliorum]
MTPRRSDLVALGAYSAVSLALGYLSLESSLTTPAWALVTLLVAGISAILVSRRHPLVALIAVIVLLPLSFAGGSGAEAVLAVGALYRCGVDLRPRQAWTAFAAAAVSGTLAALVLAIRVRLGPPLLGLAPRVDLDAWPLDWLGIATVVVAVSLMSTLVGLNVGHRRRELRALVERAEQMRRERDQEAHIAAALERERIAREMHDVIAHSLAVMVAVADGAQASAAARPEESRRAIGRVAETGRRTLVEMRRLLTTVRGEGDPVDRQPTQASMERVPSLIEESRIAGLPVRLEQTGAIDADAVVGLTVYRIVQEALTNVLRHARDVQDVVVRISITDEDVSIVVEDRSAPAPPVVDPGRGLVGIRERAAFYDGHVEAGPRPGGGWRVFVRLQTEDR